MSIVVVKGVVEKGNGRKTLVFCLARAVLGVGVPRESRAPLLEEEETTMSRIAEANAIIAKAQQHRAEVIGSALQAHALPIATVVALSFAFLQFTGDPEVEQNFEAQTVQVQGATT